MKNIFLMLCILTVVSNLMAQDDAKSILIQSQQAVCRINSCSYMLMSKSKVTGMRDTVYHIGKCNFKRAFNDTLLGRYICLENFSGITEVYNGSMYYKQRRTDTTIYIWNAEKYNFFVHQFATNSIAYGPLFNKKNIYTALLRDTTLQQTLAEDTLIDESLCYHIKSFSKMKFDMNERGITTEAELFVRKSDLMPVGHIQILHNNINKIINNFESVYLEQLIINQPIDSDMWILRSAPDNYAFIQQASIGIKNFIVADERIPDFDINLIRHDESFKNYKNKNLLIVLMDADSCYPCSKAMQLMNELYLEYKKENLSILVISNHQLKIENSGEFLISQKKMFPSLFNGEKIIEKTGAGVYPVFYFFNKNFEQVYKKDGYNNFIKKELETVISSTSIK